MAGGAVPPGGCSGGTWRCPDAGWLPRPRAALPPGRGAGRGVVSRPFPASALSGGQPLRGGPAAAAPELGSSFMDTTSPPQLGPFPPPQGRLPPRLQPPPGGLCSEFPCEKESTLNSTRQWRVLLSSGWQLCQEGGPFPEPGRNRKAGTQCLGHWPPSGTRGRGGDTTHPGAVLCQALGRGGQGRSEGTGEVGGAGAVGGWAQPCTGPPAGGSCAFSRNS